MAVRRFSSDLSVKGLQNLIDELENYKNITLVEKCEQIVSRLSDVGIHMANQNGGKFAKYITFEKELSRAEYGYTGLMLGINKVENVARWYVQDGQPKEAKISSILMAEFGSGQYAVEGHRGTFPNQTHAFEDCWYFATELDENGKPTHWIKSSGFKPTMPMYHASLDMRANITAVVKEVFSV